MVKKIVSPILTVVFCTLFFVIARYGDSYFVQAQPKGSPTPPTEKQVNAPPQEYREFIKDEREALAKQAEQHFTKVNNLFDRMLWALTVFASFLLGAAGWLFWKSRSDFRLEAQRIYQEQLGAAINETRDKLAAEVALITGYKSRKIAWVIQPGKPSIEREKNALKQFGLREIPVLSPKLGEEVNVDAYDLIILSYDDKDEDRRLLELIIQSIKQKAPAVWLLVYTYNSEGKPFEIHREEVLTKDYIKDFYWYVPANFPATLVSQTLSLARFADAKIL